MKTNEKIGKFISDNRHSKLVQDILEANKKRDRSLFSRASKKILRCVELQEMIYRTEGSIKYHSLSIKDLLVDKETYREELSQLRDNGILDNKKDDLFSLAGIEV